MEEEEEENLLTIAKDIRNDIKEMKTAVETMLIIVNDTSEKMLMVALNTVNDMYEHSNELRKVLQWYAEQQTGRKYTEV
jgi:cell division protein ZapA (FtsZ GTPase activity inhibitor)